MSELHDAALTRRTVLGRGLATVGALSLSGLVARRSLAADPATLPKPCPPSAWAKHGVLIEPTEGWEGGHIQNFTCPAEPLEGSKGWRFWYSASDERKAYTLAYAEGELGGKLRKVPAQISPGRPADGPFSIGRLPERWKPVQITHVRMKNGKHRIYFWAHGPGVLRYLAADSDDGKAYTVLDPARPVLWHPSDRAARGVPTPDGVTLGRPTSRPADEPAAEKRLISNDATTIYQLLDGTWEMYSVALVQVSRDDPAYVPEDNAPGLLRVVDRYTSADGLHFETRNRVIQRDAKDKVDQQFYYLAVTRTPQGCVGMLGDYPCRAQTMDIQWCWSVNGTEWQRPARTPWIARGKPGEPDSYGIYSGRELVQRDGVWHLFYTAVNSAHNGKDSHGPARSAIMHATTPSIWG